MDPEQLPIANVSATQLELHNRLLGIRRLLTFTVGQTDWSLSFVAPAEQSEAPAVHVRLDGHDVYVCLRDTDALVAAAVPDAEDVATLPEQILLGVLDVTLEETLVDVEAATGCAVEIVGILTGDQWHTHCATCGQIGLLLQDSDRQIPGLLLADDAALARIMELVCVVPPQQTGVGGLPLQVRVELGSANLSQDELLALRQNDVVLLEQLFASSGSAVLAAEGLPAWQVALQEDGVQLQQPWQSSGGPTDAGLPVRFQAASLTMTVSDYTSLSPGTQLPVRITGQTTMTVHGRAVAVGQLVEFRGHTGLQITGFVSGTGPSAAASERASEE